MSKSRRKVVGNGNNNTSDSAVEEILEKKIEDIVNLLASMEKGKSTLYDDVVSIVERCLIKIALRRCDNVKLTAATFLGINRNTLHKKIDQWGVGEK